jgi:hypothetical protein
MTQARQAGASARGEDCRQSAGDALAARLRRPRVVDPPGRQSAPAGPPPPGAAGAPPARSGEPRGRVLVLDGVGLRRPRGGCWWRSAGAPTAGRRSSPSASPAPRAARGQPLPGASDPLRPAPKAPLQRAAPGCRVRRAPLVPGAGTILIPKRSPTPPPADRHRPAQHRDRPQPVAGVMQGNHYRPRHSGATTHDVTPRAAAQASL